MLVTKKKHTTMIYSNRKAYYIIIYIKRIIGENTYLYI